MTKLHHLLLLMLSFFISVHAGNSQGTEIWQMKRLAVGKTVGNENSGGSINMPNLIKLDNGTYRMYYNAGSSGNQMIRVAKSTDAINWIFEGTALVGQPNPSDREYIMGGASVIKLSDGRYRMYYRACSRYIAPALPAYHIKSAISNDGITFTREPGVRMEIYPYDLTSNFKLIGHSNIFQLPNGTFAAFVSANTTSNNGPSDLFYTTSTDGLRWNSFKKMYTGYHDPVVIKKGNKFILYSAYLNEYTGKAESLDGRNWPQTMTSITIKDLNSNPTKFIEDVGALLTGDNKLYLFGNYKTGSNKPSENIVQYEDISPNSENPTPVCTLTASTTETILASCPTCGNGSFTVSASGGTPPYSFSYDNYNYQKTGIFTALRPGNYKVIIRDSKGCETIQWIPLQGQNTGGNALTEKWKMKKIAVGFKVNNEKKVNGQLSQSNVIRFESGVYRMYYVAQMGAQTTIKSASSADGINWAAEKTILTSSIDPANREYQIGGPSIVKLADGRYRLYYTANAKPVNNQLPQMHFRSAISNDGIVFYKENGVRIENSYVNRISPLKSAGRGSFYRMANNTFAAVITANLNQDSGPADLYLVTSPDGITWSYIKVLFADCNNPVVIFKDGKYIMYCTYRGVTTAKATSNDGINWGSTLETIYIYDLNGKDTPRIDDVSAVVTKNNSVYLYSNYTSGEQPFQDHIAVYERSNDSNLCIDRPTLLTVNHTEPSCLNCANGVIIAKGSNGNEPYYYTINGVIYYTSGVFGNLAAGTYEVTVKDSRGCTRSEKITMGQTTQPGSNCKKPANIWTNLTTVSTGEVYWNSVTDAEGYNLFYRPVIQNGNWSSLTFGPGVTNYTLTGLTSGTIYEVKVQAKCSGNKVSDFTQTLRFTTLSPNTNCPEVPLASARAGRTSVTVQWNYQSAAYAYQISYRLADESTVFQTTVYQPNTFYTFNNLIANRMYIFEVRSMCNGFILSSPKVVTATPRSGKYENDDPSAVMQIYPNPAKEYFTINIPDYIHNPTIRIYNLTGEEVLQKSLTEATTKIDTPNLSGGLYFCKILDKNGNVLHTQKIILEN